MVENKKIINIISNLKKQSYFPNLICISNRSLEDDLKQSSHFLFRGSTSAIEAAMYGLTPIYCRSKDPFNSQLNSLDGIELPNNLKIMNKSELELIFYKYIKFDVSFLIKDIYKKKISFNFKNK